MPAKAGIQYAAAAEILAAGTLEYWIPAFAGMTLRVEVRARN
jgi:hypothetical protein